MSFDLSKFLTEGLINSVNNELIPSELATVYAGNYLAKSLITKTQVTQVSDAITAYKAEQVSAASKAPATSEVPVTDIPASEADYAEPEPVLSLEDEIPKNVTSGDTTTTSVLIGGE